MPGVKVVPFECPQEQLGLDGIIGMLVQQTIANLLAEIDIEKAFREAMKEVIAEKVQQKKLEMDYLMDTEEVAQIIGMSKSYLEKARSQGTLGKAYPAPKNVEIGSRALYKASTVQQWIKARPEHGGEEAPIYNNQKMRKECVMQ